VIRQLGGQAMLCAVYTVHMETRSANFLIEPQNQDQIYWLSLKTKIDGFSVLPSKPVAPLDDLSFKITVTVS
jgi:hypothetical protein